MVDAMGGLQEVGQQLVAWDAVLPFALAFVQPLEQRFAIQFADQYDEGGARCVRLFT